jgi:uncharacterized protein (DUF2141 family)
LPRRRHHSRRRSPVHRKFGLREALACDDSVISNTHPPIPTPLEQNMKAQNARVFPFITLAALLVALSALCASPRVSAAELNVDVRGISGDTGNVMLALFAKGDVWLRRPSFAQQQPAKKGEVRLTFKDLAEGEYAISLYVDENGNGKMDSNAIGIPIEPFAFSNDVMGNFGPPTFEQAKFVVGKEPKSIVINLK